MNEIVPPGEEGIHPAWRSVLRGEGSPIQYPLPDDYDKALKMASTNAMTFYFRVLDARTDGSRFQVPIPFDDDRYKDPLTSAVFSMHAGSPMYAFCYHDGIVKAADMRMQTDEEFRQIVEGFAQKLVEISKPADHITIDDAAVEISQRIAACVEAVKSLDREELREGVIEVLGSNSILVVDSMIRSLSQDIRNGLSDDADLFAELDTDNGHTAERMSPIVAERLSCALNADMTRLVSQMVGPMYRFGHYVVEAKAYVARELRLGPEPNHRAKDTTPRRSWANNPLTRLAEQPAVVKAAKQLVSADGELAEWLRDCGGAIVPGRERERSGTLPAEIIAARAIALGLVDASLGFSGTRFSTHQRLYPASPLLDDALGEAAAKRLGFKYDFEENAACWNKEFDTKICEIAAEVSSRVANKELIVADVGPELPPTGFGVTTLLGPGL